MAGAQNSWVGEPHDTAAALGIMVQDLKMLVDAAPMPHSHPAYSPRAGATVGQTGLTAHGR